MVCNGYWYECECEECKLVAELYEDLAWYEEQDVEEFAYEIKELQDKIEALGFCV